MKSNKPLTVLRLSLVFALAALTACGSAGTANPSEADGKKVIEESLKSSCLKLDSFKKVNATAMEVMGTKVYEMEYEAVYSVAKQPCHGKYNAQTQSFSDGPTTHEFSIKQLNIPALPTGQSFTIARRKISFVKKENGWEGKRSDLSF